MISIRFLAGFLWRIEGILAVIQVAGYCASAHGCNTPGRSRTLGGDAALLGALPPRLIKAARRNSG
jgi:hypothetical protein